MKLRLIFCEIYQDECGDPQKRFVTQDIEVADDLNSLRKLGFCVVGMEWKRVRI